jgi:hypothetical protein
VPQAAHRIARSLLVSFVHCKTKDCVVAKSTTNKGEPARLVASALLAASACPFVCFVGAGRRSTWPRRQRFKPPRNGAKGAARIWRPAPRRTTRQHQGRANASARCDFLVRPFLLMRQHKHTRRAEPEGGGGNAKCRDIVFVLQYGARRRAPLVAKASSSWLPPRPFVCRYRRQQVR